MSGLISVVSSPFNIMIKLREIVRDYQRKKSTEAHFFKAFENEITEYISIYDQMMKLSEKQVLPILESIDKELTVPKMRKLFEELSAFPLLQAQLIEAFVSFAKTCTEVSALKGFMDDLKTYHILMYDFVWTMKNTYVRENTVKINGRYYRFFKTYEDEIFGKIRVDELDNVIQELKNYVKKMKHYIQKTALITHHVRKKYSRNMRLLAKSAENMRIEATSIVDLRTYLPKTLVPLAVFMEEFL